MMWTYHNNDVLMTEADVGECVKRLACGKALGVPGERLGCGAPLRPRASCCSHHRLVPDTFLHAVLIPLHKTGKASHLASSHRPVTLSSVLGLHTWHTCQQHQPATPAPGSKQRLKLPQAAKRQAGDIGAVIVPGAK